MDDNSLVLFFKFLQIVVFLLVEEIDCILSFHNSFIRFVLRVSNDLSDIGGVFLDDK